MTLTAEPRGEPHGPAVVLLHGLTATRHYVVMGSKVLERAGCRVIGYDARGHGDSTPAPDPADYQYGDLVADLGAVLDAEGVERALLAGVSMGAHTAAAFALARPKRVAGLVIITPAARGYPSPAEAFVKWDRLAGALERDGIEGFLGVYREEYDEGRYSGTVETVIRQRLARHRHPEGVAAALRAVPRSVPFDGIEALAAIAAPTLVVGSRDEADPGHPLAVAAEWARTIPSAELRVEEEGRPPLAWQGGQLSRATAELLDRAGVGP